MTSLPKVKNPIAEGDGDPRHGTQGGYTNHACRCDECRDAANTAQQAWARANSEALRVLARRHGIEYREIRDQILREQGES